MSTAELRVLAACGSLSGTGNLGLGSDLVASCSGLGGACTCRRKGNLLVICSGLCPFVGSGVRRFGLVLESFVVALLE